MSVYSALLLLESVGAVLQEVCMYLYVHNTSVHKCVAYTQMSCDVCAKPTSKHVVFFIVYLFTLVNKNGY